MIAAYHAAADYVMNSLCEAHTCHRGSHRQMLHKIVKVQSRQLMQATLDCRMSCCVVEPNKPALQQSACNAVSTACS